VLLPHQRLKLTRGAEDKEPAMSERVNKRESLKRYSVHR